jgi:hypothetical protein
MSITKATSSTTSAERRQTVDRRQRSEAVATDRRQPQADRRSSPAAVSPSTASSSRATFDQGKTDSVAVSADARQVSGGSKEGEGSSKGFDSFLKSFEGNFPASEGNDSTPLDQKEQPVQAVDKPQQTASSTPEQERREFLERTGRTLYDHSGFTAGEDGLTRRQDYQAIAEGKRNEEFSNHLKEIHPAWDEQRIAQEVRSLQESSRQLVSDQSAFDFYDNATNQGDPRDQAISAQDLASGRLRNDTSKDYPPQLSAQEIERMHKDNPVLGNEAVTNKYYHQSQGLNQRLGGDADNFRASWPAFGQMASNSAGAMIRDDGIPGTDCLKDAIADGNRKVFLDIAPHYDSYLQASKEPDFNYDEWANKEFGPRPAGVESLAEASRKPDFDLEKWQQSLREVPPNEKKQPYLEWGKPYLRDSFDLLEAAVNEQDPDKKQELLLASNVMAGRHEQANLQPEIERATAPLTGSGVERKLLEKVTDIDPIFYMPNGKGSGAPDPYKVDGRVSGQASSALQEISDPTVRAALAVGQGGSEVSAELRGEKLIGQTGTENWADLDARMQTIAGLMVANQEQKNMGEYILDYDKPRLSTTGNLVEALPALAKTAAETAISPALPLGKLGWEALRGLF